MNIRFFLSLGLLALWTVPCLAAESAALEPSAGKPIKVGEFSVIPLRDGAHRFPLSLFTGATAEEMLKIAGSDPVPGSFNVFAITQGKERFLVDTGNGTLRADRTPLLPRALEEAGIAPAGVSKIFITHLHGDHAGGLVRDGKPAFPNAVVYVAKPEFKYWMSEEAMQKAPEDRRALFTSMQTVLGVLKKNFKLAVFTPGEEVSPGITSRELYGHTPGHCGFMLASQGKKLLFVGDLLHGGALQMPRPDITVSFDSDREKARATRLTVLKEAADQQLPIACAHLPFPGVGLVRAQGAGYVFEPIKQ